MENFSFVPQNPTFSAQEVMAFLDLSPDVEDVVELIFLVFSQKKRYSLKELEEMIEAFDYYSYLKTHRNRWAENRERMTDLIQFPQKVFRHRGEPVNRVVLRIDPFIVNKIREYFTF